MEYFGILRPSYLLYCIACYDLLDHHVSSILIQHPSQIRFAHAHPPLHPYCNLFSTLGNYVLAPLSFYNRMILETCYKYEAKYYSASDFE